MKNIKFEELEKKLGYTFTNKSLLKYALTHKTHAFEAKSPIEYNERLEFLGDSVLDFIVAEELYKSNKYFSEGDLTVRRAIWVNNEFLAEKSIDLGIGKFLLFGKGELKQNGANNRTNLANALEALIGAIYLDSGIESARRFILERIVTGKF